MVTGAFLGPFAGALPACTSNFDSAPGAGPGPRPATRAGRLDVLVDRRLVERLLLHTFLRSSSALRILLVDHPLTVSNGMAPRRTGR